VPVETAPAIVNEITLVGSRCGRFEPALKLLASKKVHVGDMISDSIRLDYAPLAFERARQSGVLKVLLHP
jgi:alcohol dehydrogenase